MKRSKNSKNRDSHNLLFAVAIVLGLLVTMLITITSGGKGSRAASCGAQNTACCWVKNVNGGYSASCNVGLNCIYSQSSASNICVGGSGSGPTPTPARYATPTPARYATPTPAYNIPTPAGGSGCGSLNQACCWVRNASGSYVASCSQGSCKYNAAKNANFCN